MNLVLDIGNTLTKAAIFENDTLVRTYQRMDEKNLRELLHHYSPEALMVSTVADCPDWLLDMIAKHQHYFLLNAETPLPFDNLYKSPKTLGADRVAAVAAAVKLFPGKTALAIDAGSCITYDLVDEHRCYYGGSISPGIQMRCRAMHTFTARLPLVQVNTVEQPVLLQGTNTEEALLSGAWHGTLAEITQMIRMYEDKFGPLQVVICGGDAILLSSELTVAHQFLPELILIGLNTILAYNVIY